MARGPARGGEQPPWASQLFLRRSTSAPPWATARPPQHQLPFRSENLSSPGFQRLPPHTHSFPAAQLKESPPPPCWGRAEKRPLLVGSTWMAPVWARLPGMLLSALTSSRAPSALLFTERVPDAGTVLCTGTEQREADLLSLLSSSRLVREADSHANIIPVRAPNGAVLREQITKWLHLDHGHWGRIVEDALTNMTGNSIPDKGNRIGGSAVGGVSPGISETQRWRVAEAGVQGGAQLGAVESTY